MAPPQLTSPSSLLQPIQRSPIKRTIPPRNDHSAPSSSSSSSSSRAAPAATSTAFQARPHTVAVDVDYGTTGLLVVVDGSDLFIASCGDSRAIAYTWREPHITDPTRTPPPPADSRGLSPSLTAHVSLTSQVSRSLSCPSTSLSTASSSPSLTSSPTRHSHHPSLSPPSSTTPWHPLYTTADHDPSLPDAASQLETTRILTHAGLIHSLPGQHRIYPDTISLAEARARALTLNMSRALGHNMLSQHGVVHRPEMGHARLRWGEGRGRERGGGGGEGGGGGGVGGDGE